MIVDGKKRTPPPPLPLTPPKELEQTLVNVMNQASNEVVHWGRALERWLVLEEVRRKLDTLINFTEPDAVEAGLKVMIEAIEASLDELKPRQAVVSSDPKASTAAPSKTTPPPISPIAKAIIDKEIDELFNKEEGKL